MGDYGLLTSLNAQAAFEMSPVLVQASEMRKEQ